MCTNCSKSSATHYAPKKINHMTGGRPNASVRSGSNLGTRSSGSYGGFGAPKVKMSFGGKRNY